MTDWSPEDGLPPELVPPNIGKINEDSQEFKALIEQVFQVRNIDFRGYKKSTLTRRLARRLHARNVTTYAQYQDILNKDPLEYDRMFNDLTINETYFFRNQSVFDKLATQLDELTDSAQGVIKVWSAACSTGEEAYSLAMLIDHYLKTTNKSINVEIYATDIDSKALAHARKGFYDEDAITHLGNTWRSTYFRPVTGGYEVVPELRERIHFDQQNLSASPPSHKFDCILCRNVLIYFAHNLQMHVFHNLHRGLKDTGLLVLGEYEIPLQEARSLFTVVDFDTRIYRKRANFTSLKENSMSPKKEEP